MRSLHGLDDAELLRLTVQGDPDAFAAFYRRHLSAVLRTMARSGASREVAADLTAEVFAQALVGAARFDPARGSAGAWLAGISRNKLRESWREGRVENAARIRLGMEPLALNDADLEQVDDILSGAPALDLVSGLPAGQREAVVGRVLEEEPYEQLASRLECSESVVRKRVSRGLSRLRTKLEDGS